MRFTDKQLNMMNRVMAVAQLGPGATKKNIKTFAKTIKSTRKHNKSEAQVDATLALLDLDKDLQIALKLFSNVYMPEAPDTDTLVAYELSAQELYDIRYEIDKMAAKFIKGHMPKSKRIAELRQKLVDIFEDTGLDYGNIENAKSEKRFDLTSLLKALNE